MRKESRMPQIGDLLFVTCRASEYNSGCICQTHGDKHVGFVVEIQRDSYGHSRHVLVEWSNEPPKNYRPKFGYSGTNIHNIRDEFHITRNGESIP